MGTADKTHLFEPAGAERAAPLLAAACQVVGADLVVLIDTAPRVIVASDPAWRGRPICTDQAPGPDSFTGLFSDFAAHLGVPAGKGGLWLVALAHETTAFDAGTGAVLAPIAASVALLLAPEDSPSAELAAVWYHQVLADLLGAAVEDADRAILGALAQTGQQLALDRIQVCLQRSGELALLHLWLAEGAPPPPEKMLNLPPMPDGAPLARHVRDAVMAVPDLLALASDDPLRVALNACDVRSILSVPFRVGGRIEGCVAYVTTRAPRHLTAAERALLGTLTDAIGNLLHRQQGKDRLRKANTALVAQRNRLRATLAAMPDPAIEVDHAGRVIAFHAGSNVQMPAAPGLMLGRMPEEFLAPEAAQRARALLEEASEVGVARLPACPVETSRGPKLYDIWASRLVPGPNGAPGHVIVARDVTEEVARTRDLQRLGRVAEYMTNMVLLTDRDERITWVNPAFERRMGYRLDEIRGLHPDEVTRVDKSDRISAVRVRRALAERTPLDTEQQIRTRDGTAFWVETTIQPLYDTDGNFDGFLSVRTDVTERRHYQEEMSQSVLQAMAARQRLGAMIEALPDAVGYYDAEDRLYIWNGRYRDCHPHAGDRLRAGTRYEEILRSGVSAGAYPEAQGREEAWIEAQLAQHDKDYSESEIPLSDGQWLRQIVKRTADGWRIRLLTDITDLRQRADRADADREASMHGAQDGIAMIEEDGTLVYMNPAYRAMLGLAPEAEVSGTSWLPLHGKGARRALAAALCTRRWHGELIGHHPEGRDVPLDVTLTLREAGGLLCLAHDVTEQRRALQERSELREDLQIAQRREVIAQLAAGVAHDFNNLLAAIAGSAVLVADGTDPEGNSRRILSAVQQAEGLVGRLVDLGARRSRNAWFDLRDIALGACDLVRPGMPVGAELVPELPDTPLMVEADRTDLMQVLLNLMLNAGQAIDETEAASGTVTLRVRRASAEDLGAPFELGAPEPGRDYFLIEVADTGPGILPEIRDQIFERHFTTKGDKGTGLGLPIVASVVTGNGGAIGVRTAPGAGTVFGILWPERPPEPLTRATAPTLGHAGTARLDGKAILVVDDNPDVLRVLAAFLEQSGAEVAPSTDPTDVLEAVRTDPEAWDLIVTDYRMPQMTGAALARAVRRIAPALPIVLVTAQHDLGADVQTGSDRIFAAILNKPISRDELWAAAENAIAGQTTRT